MIDEKENKNEELEVNLEEVETEKEVNVPLNPLENLQQQEEEPSKDEDKSFENERQIKLEKAPAYSEDMPYSVKVRKRIQKEVAKRAEAEQRNVELEDSWQNNFKIRKWRKSSCHQIILPLVSLLFMKRLRTRWFRGLLRFEGAVRRGRRSRRGCRSF